MHPSDGIRGVKSKKLSNKRIVLGVTGSIAAVETIKLARELIRHGAEVIPVMTKSALKIIHPDSLEFASGNKPIIEITGKTEHVSYCGKINDPCDLLLISPCTANTISKIVNGIDDTSITTFATTAIGSGIPILIVPAMHISMYDHNIIQSNISKAKDIGINILEPILFENKAKMVDFENIVANVIRLIGKRDYTGKKILIIGGSSSEPIDDVRTLTNRSSGKTAIYLAKNAFFRGANVELWYGQSITKIPNYISNKRFDTIESLIVLLNKSIVKKFDIIILCAALSDYIPKKIKGKIKSSKSNLNIECYPANKFISILKEKMKDTRLIGFKVEDKKKNLIDESCKLLKENNLDFVIANTISAFDNDQSEIWAINRDKKAIHKKGNKEIIADHILDIIK